MMVRSILASVGLDINLEPSNGMDIGRILLVVVVDGIASEIINKMARLQFPSQISPSEYY